MNICETSVNMKNIFCKLAVLIIAAAVTASAGAGEALHEENFEEGIAGWGTYRREDKASELEHSRDTAYEGEYSLKVRTKGLSPLEGPQKSFRVEPDRRYTVTVKAKGEGKVMLCATGAGGWLYGRNTDLTDEWQELKISIFITSASIAPNVITVPTAQRVTFYLDNLRIEKEPLPEVFDVDVEPVKFEAQDFPGNARIVEEASASGGAYSEGMRNFNLAMRMPFPVTSRPVYIYLKAWVEDNENYSILLSNSLPFQGVEGIASVRLPKAGEWVWVKAGPFAPGKFVENFSVRNVGSGPGERARLDCVVETTRDNLTAEDLENIR